jgi:putative SOS response-associated peptidase YedK
MCARYTLTLEQAKLVIAGLVHIFAFAPRYNIGPAQRVPVVLSDAKGARQDEMRWGFKSQWSSTLHINAQAERVRQTATFKALLHQRCLVPMDGFYEWKPDKSPVRFVRRRRDMFCVAGLWKAEEKPGLDLPVTEQSFVLLTTAASPNVAPIHSRMPFIVQPQHYDWWLAGDLAETVLNCPDDTPLEWYPVSREVNNVRNEHPSLVRPVPVEKELF